MSQKVINQIIENKNLKKHIKDSKPIKTTIQKKKKNQNQNPNLIENVSQKSYKSKEKKTKTHQKHNSKHTHKHATIQSTHIHIRENPTNIFESSEPNKTTILFQCHIKI